MLPNAVRFLAFLPFGAARSARLLALAALALAAPIGRSVAAQAPAELFFFPLQTEQQVPPAASTASGDAMLSLDALTGIVSVSGDYAGLAGPAFQAHLHGPAAAGTGGPPFALLSVTAGTAGTVSGLAFLSQAQVADVRAGRVYLDVHTDVFPGGELRGQVCRLAAAATRNAGPNPASYTCNAPRFGGLFQATVDLTTTGHAFAFLFAFDSPADLVLPGGQRLLCLDAGGTGEVFTGVGLGPLPGPLATFELRAPPSLAFCNLHASSQALHLGGVLPFALSNARDLSMGF